MIFEIDGIRIDARLPDGLDQRRILRWPLFIVINRGGFLVRSYSEGPVLLRIWNDFPPGTFNDFWFRDPSYHLIFLAPSTSTADGDAPPRSPS